MDRQQEVIVEMQSARGPGHAGFVTVITVLDRHNHAVFQPMPFQMTAALLGLSQLACSCRSMLTCYPNITLLQRYVTGTDVGTRDSHDQSEMGAGGSAAGSPGCSATRSG